jgi:hypothetical protein
LADDRGLAFAGKWCSLGKQARVNIEQIRQRLANGFKPFTLCLSGGRKLAVGLRVAPDGLVALAAAAGAFVVMAFLLFMLAGIVYSQIGL